MGDSDFHGSNKTNHFLGSGQCNLNIHENIVKPWIDPFVDVKNLAKTYQKNKEKEKFPYFF